MAVYQSSIGAQLGAFEREVERMAWRVLLAGGRRVRARMTREQLSFPAGPGGGPPRWLKAAAARLRAAGKGGEADQLLESKGYVKPAFGVRRISGRLVRSQRYRNQRTAGGIRLVGELGIGAPYAGEHEDRGRIAFKRVFEEEARRTEEELRIGLEFLARSPGRAGGLSSSAEALLAEDVDAGRGALLAREAAGFRAHRTRRSYLAKARRLRRILRRQGRLR